MQANFRYFVVHDRDGFHRVYDSEDWDAKTKLRDGTSPFIKLATDDHDLAVRFATELNKSIYDIHRDL